MNSNSLAHEYYKRSLKRIKAIDVLFVEESYPDVIRECQEVVELLLKATLRVFGIDPPKWHDVGSILADNESSFPEQITQNLNRITSLSKRLRKERELSFYGEEDFIPSDNYTRSEAIFFLDETKWLATLLEEFLS